MVQIKIQLHQREMLFGFKKVIDIGNGEKILITRNELTNPSQVMCINNCGPGRRGRLALKFVINYEAVRECHLVDLMGAIPRRQENNIIDVIDATLEQYILR